MEMSMFTGRQWCLWVCFDMPQGGVVIGLLGMVFNDSLNRHKKYIKFKDQTELKKYYVKAQRPMRPGARQ